MMYLHFCKNCSRIHILNGHKMFCPKCENTLVELQISYLKYLSFTPKEREQFIDLCQNETSLNEISTTYRMYKYSKWYRNLQIINQDSAQNKQDS